MHKISRILIIDCSICVTKQLKEMLEYEKYEVKTANCPSDVEKIINGQDIYDLVICDSVMKFSNNQTVIDYILKIKPKTNIIVLCNDPSVDWVIETMKKGIYDIVCKPLNNPNKLFTDIRDITNCAEEDYKETIKNKKHRKSKLSYFSQEPNIVGSSKKTKKLKDIINIVAPSEARVLITGENGTGKELVAQCIHNQSNRYDKPMVEVNCAAIPSELIESELFGHEKGSFTSANGLRKGRFELAEGGTLFLDEIGDMSLNAQSKLLRVLQEKKMNRVGGEKDIAINVRVIAATNKNLIDEIEKRNFREDLYHRLNVVNINVPPLRERIDDIPELVDFFIKKICASYNKTPLEITDSAIKLLKEKKWRGNIRELSNIVERLVLFTKDVITKEDIIAYCSDNFSI